jgi:hypothetical protein
MPQIHPKGINKGNRNGQWKEGGCSYRSLHEYIRNNKPKSLICEDCGEPKRLEIACIDNKYTRNVDDYRWLCRRCHMISDGRMLNLKQYNEDLAICLSVPTVKKI